MLLGLDLFFHLSCLPNPLAFFLSPARDLVGYDAAVLGGQGCTRCSYSRTAISSISLRLDSLDNQISGIPATP